MHVNSQHKSRKRVLLIIILDSPHSCHRLRKCKKTSIWFVLWLAMALVYFNKTTNQTNYKPLLSELIFLQT